VHATDRTNASRTMLFDVHRLQWDEELLDRLRVPGTVLPDVRTSSGSFGETDPEAFFGARIPIAGVAGDQQASLFGQACFEPGETKNTHGTGSFVLMNTGARAVPSTSGLLTTIAAGPGDDPVYALEGSIFVTGAAIQWLRDGLGLIAHADEAGPLAASVPDSGGVCFVPALTGLGAPWWDPRARGTIVGLTRGTTRAHLARATVEAIAYQTRAVVDAMRDETGLAIPFLRVDGGASAMDVLLQLQADQLGVPVLRSFVQDTTALGAAYLAGLGRGVWSSTDDVRRNWHAEREFNPANDRAGADAGYARWRRAVQRSLDWDQETGSEG
jgi:glycerol kinase